MRALWTMVASARGWICRLASLVASWRQLNGSRKAPMARDTRKQESGRAALGKPRCSAALCWEWSLSGHEGSSLPPCPAVASLAGCMRAERRPDDSESWAGGEATHHHDKPWRGKCSECASVEPAAWEGDCLARRRFLQRRRGLACRGRERGMTCRRAMGPPICRDSEAQRVGQTTPVILQAAP